MRAVGRAFGVALAVVLLVVVARSLGPFIPAATAGVHDLGALAPIAFILVCAVAEVAFIPGSLLTLMAGAIFGLVEGTVLAMIGAMLGASVAFLVARHWIRGLVERWVLTSPKLAALDAALASEGRKIVFLARLTPLIPFNALNYALGVTRIRFMDYLIGSLGMLPGTLLYAYYGLVMGGVARLAAGASPPRTAAYHVLMAVGLLATIAMVAILTRAARRALAVAAVSGAGERASGRNPTRP